MICEQCWEEAFIRSQGDGRPQTEHYFEVIEEDEGPWCGDET